MSASNPSLCPTDSASSLSSSWYKLLNDVPKEVEFSDDKLESRLLGLLERRLVGLYLLLSTESDSLLDLARIE